MRISAKPEDPNYDALAHASKVTLDGVELDGCCFTADEELGEVEVIVFGGDGRPVVENGEIKTEIKRGKVVVTLPIL